MTSFLASDTAKMEALIRLLTVVMTIGKYLPAIVAAFATINLSIAILSFAVWNNVFFGALNSVFALGGFIFLRQLLARRNIHRYNYRYTGRHIRGPQANQPPQQETKRKANPDAYSA